MPLYSKHMLLIGYWRRIQVSSSEKFVTFVRCPVSETLCQLSMKPYIILPLWTLKGDPTGQVSEMPGGSRRQVGERPSLSFFSGGEIEQKLWSCRRKGQITLYMFECCWAVQSVPATFGHNMSYFRFIPCLPGRVNRSYLNYEFSLTDIKPPRTYFTS